MILVFNSGSTSLKFALFHKDLACVCSGEIDWAQGNRSKARLRMTAGEVIRQETVDAGDDLAAARVAVSALADEFKEPLLGIGHRIVHGGEAFRESIPINPAVVEGIRRQGPLAPLHNPPALKTIGAAEALFPGTPQVAVFDTKFYRSLPSVARIYPIPYEWHERFGVWRYGFHGLSHEYCAERAAELLGAKLEDLRIVSCHLGGGCSATAIAGGRAVASTMGFSPLEGLVMGTRSGSVDPGLLLHLQIQCGMSVEDLNETLNRHSGLLGISGVSPDYAAVEQAAGQGHERAALAIELFNERVRSAIAGLASAMNGADVVIFTDRIGERSSDMRRAVCEGLGFMGVRLNTELNARALPDLDVSAKDSTVRVLVIQTREDLMVARETSRVLNGLSHGAA